MDVAIEQARPYLADRLGVGRLTEFLIAYAIAERAINRFLSAAVDGFDSAADANLKESTRLLDAAKSLLVPHTPSY